MAKGDIIIKNILQVPNICTYMG